MEELAEKDGDDEDGVDGGVGFSSEEENAPAAAAAGDDDGLDNDIHLLPPPLPAGTGIKSERVSPVDTPTTINDPYYFVIGKQAPAA